MYPQIECCVTNDGEGKSPLKDKISSESLNREIFFYRFVTKANKPVCEYNQWWRCVLGKEISGSFSDHSSLFRGRDLNNLKTCLRFHGLGLNPIFDSFDLNAFCPGRVAPN